MIAALIIQIHAKEMKNKSKKGKILDELISPKEKTNFQDR